MEEAALYILINGLDETAQELNISKDKLEKFITQAEVWKFEFFKQMKDIIVSSVEAMGKKGTSEALSLPDIVVEKISSGANAAQIEAEVRKAVENIAVGTRENESQTVEVTTSSNETQTINQETDNYNQTHRKVTPANNLLQELDELISRGFNEKEILRRTNIPREMVSNRIQQYNKHIAACQSQFPQAVSMPPMSILQDLPTLPARRTMVSDRSPLYRNHTNSPASSTAPLQAPLHQTPPPAPPSNPSNNHTASPFGAFNTRYVRRNIVVATGDDVAPDYSYRPETGTINLDT